MKRALLPLNALRAFDAAARHLSFKAAAEELSVTPAAVSQQVRALEDLFGAPLFKRTGRSLILTERAQLSLQALREGFERIEEATEALEQSKDQAVVRISVSPTFASKWLVPRLERFYQKYASAVVKVSASMELVDFQKEDFDLAVRYGAGTYPGNYSEELMREAVFPVCSPEILNGNRGIRAPADLAGATLIHDDSSLDDESCPTWSMWLKAAGVKPSAGQRALHFNQTSLAIEAAVAGRGVALAKAAMAASDLEAGRLARPFDDEFPVAFAYYIVCPEASLKRDCVAGFIAWLREEAQAFAETDRGNDPAA